MASQDPLNQWLTLPYSVEGKTYSLTIKAGDAKFLGIKESALGSTFREVTLPAKTYSRRAYPGGPKIPVNRPAQVVRRQVGSAIGSRRTNKKLILKTALEQTTVYYTGPVNAAVAWLKKNSLGIGPLSSVQIYGPTGTPYTPLLAKDALQTA